MHMLETQFLLNCVNFLLKDERKRMQQLDPDKVGTDGSNIQCIFPIYVFNLTT